MPSTKKLGKTKGHVMSKRSSKRRRSHKRSSKRSSKHTARVRKNSKKMSKTKSQSKKSKSKRSMKISGGGDCATLISKKKNIKGIKICKKDINKVVEAKNIFATTISDNEAKRTFNKFDLLSNIDAYSTIDLDQQHPLLAEFFASNYSK